MAPVTMKRSSVSNMPEIRIFTKDVVKAGRQGDVIIPCPQQTQQTVVRHFHQVEAVFVYRSCMGINITVIRVTVSQITEKLVHVTLNIGPAH